METNYRMNLEFKVLVICASVVLTLCIAVAISALLHAPQEQKSEPEPYNYTENNSGGFVETEPIATPAPVPVPTTQIQSVEWKPIVVNVTMTPQPTAVPAVTPTYWTDTRQQPDGYPKYMTFECCLPFRKDDSHPECEKKASK